MNTLGVVSGLICYAVAGLFVPSDAIRKLDYLTIALGVGIGVVAAALYFLVALLPTLVAFRAGFRVSYWLRRRLKPAASPIISNHRRRL